MTGTDVRNDWMRLKDVWGAVFLKYASGACWHPPQNDLFDKKKKHWWPTSRQLMGSRLWASEEELVMVLEWLYPQHCSKHQFYLPHSCFPNKVTRAYARYIVENKCLVDKGLLNWVRRWGGLPFLITKPFNSMVFEALKEGDVFGCSMRRIMLDTAMGKWGPVVFDTWSPGSGVLVKYRGSVQLAPPIHRKPGRYGRFDDEVGEMEILVTAKVRSVESRGGFTIVHVTEPNMALKDLALGLSE